MNALGSGAAGALVLTALHETVRRLVERAPRMDVVAMRGIERGLRRAGMSVPDDESLHRIALAGDLLSNSLYYAAVPAGSRAATWTRGAVLGMLAGAGAVMLPRPLGLGDPPHNADPLTRALTVAWYLAGGMAAAGAANAARQR